MYDNDDLDRIKLVSKKIDYILDICKDDIKGAIDTRNFIAHDYEGINLPIIEFIIRDRLPILKDIIIKFS